MLSTSALIFLCGRWESDWGLCSPTTAKLQGPAAFPQSVRRDQHLCPLSLQLSWRGIAMHHGWSPLHSGKQWESCSFSDVQQTGSLPSLPMRHLLQHGQHYLSWRCLDEFELNAIKIIPKAVRGYCHEIMLWAGKQENPEGPSFKISITKRQTSRAATPY